MTTSQRRIRYAVIAAVAILVVAVVFLLSRPRVEDAQPDPTPVTPSANVNTTPGEQPSPSPQACISTATEGFVPTRFTIEAMGVDEPVIALGEDAEGAIAAPPKDEPRMASWWKNGPKPGDEQGRAVLSIHTYRNGGALGNELFTEGEERTSPLQPGDIIALHDDAGNTTCYEYSHFLEIVADDYDPDSDVMVDFETSSSLVIVICSAFDWDTETWENRVLFYADAI